MSILTQIVAPMSMRTHPIASRSILSQPVASQGIIWQPMQFMSILAHSMLMTSAPPKKAEPAKQRAGYMCAESAHKRYRKQDQAQMLEHWRHPDRDFGNRAGLKFWGSACSRHLRPRSCGRPRCCRYSGLRLLLFKNFNSPKSRNLKLVET